MREGRGAGAFGREAGLSREDGMSDQPDRITPVGGGSVAGAMPDPLEKNSRSFDRLFSIMSSRDPTARSNALRRVDTALANLRALWPATSPRKRLDRGEFFPPGIRP